MLPGLLSVDQIGHNGNNILDRNTNLESSSTSLSNSYLLHRISLTDSHSLKQGTVLLNRIKIDSDGEGNTNLIGTSISIHYSIHPLIIPSTNSHRSGINLGREAKLLQRLGDLLRLSHQRLRGGKREDWTLDGSHLQLTPFPIDIQQAWRTWQISSHHLHHHLHPHSTYQDGHRSCAQE